MALLGRPSPLSVGLGNPIWEKRSTLLNNNLVYLNRRGGKTKTSCGVLTLRLREGWQAVSPPSMP